MTNVIDNCDLTSFFISTQKLQFLKNSLNDNGPINATKVIYDFTNSKKTITYLVNEKVKTYIVNMPFQ